LLLSDLTGLPLTRGSRAVQKMVSRLNTANPAPGKSYRIFDGRKGIEKKKGESLLCTVKKPDGNMLCI